MRSVRDGLLKIGERALEVIGISAGYDDFDAKLLADRNLLTMEVVSTLDKISKTASAIEQIEVLGALRAVAPDGYPMETVLNFDDFTRQTFIALGYGSVRTPAETMRLAEEIQRQIDLDQQEQQAQDFAGQAPVAPQA